MIEVTVDRKEIAEKSKNMELYTVEQMDPGEWRVISPGGETYVVKVFEIEDPRYSVECTCEGFRHRKHVCKHIAKVFRESFDPETNRFNIPREEEEVKMVEAKAEPVYVEKEVLSERKERAEKKAEEMQLLLVADEEDEKIAEELGLITPDSVALENYPLAYTFRDRGGREHRFLSLAGWIKVARIQGNIEVRIDKIIEYGGKTAVVAVARDLKRNVEMPGLSSKSTREEFELEILASKAIRNALKKVVDPEIVQSVLTMADERGQIRRLEVMWQ